MSAPAIAPRPQDATPALLLSFVGGYVDTFSFVTLFGLFTAHVTGNFVLVGAAMAGHGHAGIVGKLLALPAFVAAVAATRWLQRRQVLATAASLVRAQLAVLVAFMAAGLAAGPFDDGDAAAAICVGLVGVVAMAIQNTASRTVFAHLSPSTVMTGNVTQVTVDLVDLLQHDAEAGAIAARVARLWPPILAFATGAIAAGLLCGELGFWALLAPAGALLILLQRLRPVGAAGLA
jgi:uncharacterized membrane protein YoaK (UPF0700 family)